MNGDGFDDILIGNPDASPNDNHKAGSAWVYSGADGSLIYQFHGTTYNKYLGGSVSGAGDINNDGFPDFMFKDFLDVVIHSGVDGSLIYRLTQPSGAYGFGQSLAAMGDVDEDGFGDILIGAPHADVNFIEAAGRAFIYSGATGQLLYEFEGQHYELELGYAVACAGDETADGIQDALLGSNGGVYLYSGANGDHLFERYGPTSDCIAASRTKENYRRMGTRSRSNSR